MQRILPLAARRSKSHQSEVTLSTVDELAAASEEGISCGADTDTDLETEFGELFRRESQAIFNKVYGIVGTKSDAEDVVQHAWEKVWLRMSSSRRPALENPAGFAMRCAINDALRVLKRRRRYDRITQLFKSRATDDVLANPHAMVDGWDALQSLAPDERAIVILKVVDQYQYDEIAALLGMKEGTVKSKHSRARAKLRKVPGWR